VTVAELNAETPESEEARDGSITVPGPDGGIPYCCAWLLDKIAIRPFDMSSTKVAGACSRARITPEQYNEACADRVDQIVRSEPPGHAPAAGCVRSLREVPLDDHNLARYFWMTSTSSSSIGGLPPGGEGASIAGSI